MSAARETRVVVVVVVGRAPAPTISGHAPPAARVGVQSTRVNDPPGAESRGESKSANASNPRTRAGGGGVAAAAAAAADLLFRFLDFVTAGVFFFLFFERGARARAPPPPPPATPEAAAGAAARPGFDGWHPGPVLRSPPRRNGRACTIRALTTLAPAAMDVADAYDDL
eukprot:30895-Pelagococcus_subviridis.AAC.2